MNPRHLAILRTIAERQPILKDDLYSYLALHLPHNGQYYDLRILRQQGYIQYERKKGPVWLTIRGRQVLDEI